MVAGGTRNKQLQPLVATLQPILRASQSLDLCIPAPVDLDWTEDTSGVQTFAAAVHRSVACVSFSA